MRYPPGRRRVLLVFPPIREVPCGEKWRPTDSPVPPLGPLYLAAPLRRAGFPVRFVDLTVDQFSEEEYFSLLEHADYILISCLMKSMAGVMRIIQDARRVNPEAVIICGGPHCTESGSHVEGSDLTLYGEGEDIITDILERIEGGRTLRGITGLSYLENGRLHTNGGRRLVDDLDGVDFPDFELTHGKNYGCLFGEKILHVTSIISSRGCPYQCRYCSYRGIRYRERSVANVIQEIGRRVDEGAKYLAFHDDNFLMNKPRVMSLMDEIIRNEFKLHILIMGRVDSANRELYKMLRRAGVIIIVFGIESANQDILDFYNKRTTVEKCREAVRLADAHDILTYGNFIIGAPFEGEAHFENNRAFFRSAPLDFLNVHILHYVKGTSLWEEAVEKGLIGRDEVMVAADRRLSRYTHEELIRIQSGLIQDFYHDTHRLFRLARKISRNFSPGFVVRFARIFLNRNLFRSAEKFHDSS